MKYNISPIMKLLRNKQKKNYHQLQTKRIFNILYLARVQIQNENSWQEMWRAELELFHFEEDFQLWWRR